MEERNGKAIEILNECLCCDSEMSERGCRHYEVPDVIKFSVFESS